MCNRRMCQPTASTWSDHIGLITNPELGQRHLGDVGRVLSFSAAALEQRSENLPGRWAQEQAAQLTRSHVTAAVVYIRFELTF